MWKKLASLAGMISASLTVSSCETSAYKPMICDPGYTVKNGRCAKVAKIAKVPTPRRPAVATTTPRRSPITPQNVYGLPQ